MDKFDVMDFMMHRQAMDVCIEIVMKSAERTWVRYWNLGYSGKPWLIDGEQYLLPTEILNSDDWSILTPEQMTTPRVHAGNPSGEFSC